MSKKFFAPICTLVLVLGLSGCNDSDDENLAGGALGSSSDLMIQQIGESMVSMDESSGNSNGSFSALEAACSGVSFGACGATASGTVVKDFAGCTLAGGLVTVSGTVTLTYAGTGATTCSMPVAGDSVTRVPSFRATLPASAGAFETSAVSTGQTLTRTGSGTFTFASTGIRKVYSASGGTTVADITTSTGTDITISGTTRTDRVVDGGTLIVTNNTSGQTCTMTPDNVAWTSTSCSCPTSGTWTGTCTTGEPVAVTFTSTCGSVQTSFGTTSKTLTLERCN